ncbi:transcriptional regulator [Azospirillum thiophilum]|uniref:Transcriptional regulator n=1 Tax=Azospirillum thiophilum TaxID=528244 RepID=A0AAC8W689_9PROT|nr:helix-turn-helix transcriptional regulator [Azospirillum thiophilum]ALG75591.1 transcriptional regulator [Azospirillum thiophilum]KJR62111.1 transcriptional regulator [Azospirillum thiophilum]
MPRRKPPSREALLEARHALLRMAEGGELVWAEGVRAMRRCFGMTQAEFGRSFGLTTRQVSQLETGAANPTVATLERLALPFGLTVGLIPEPAVSEPAAKEPER